MSLKFDFTKMVNMPNYDNCYFDCTIAVSYLGRAILVSKLPDQISCLIDCSYPEECNWEGIPKDPGIYRCRMYVSLTEPISVCDNHFRLPVHKFQWLRTYSHKYIKVRCSEYYPTHSVIKEAAVVLDSDKQDT